MYVLHTQYSTMRLVVQGQPPSKRKKFRRSGVPNVSGPSQAAAKKFRMEHSWGASKHARHRKRNQREMKDSEGERD